MPLLPLKKKTKALEERGEALGLNPNDPSSFPDDLREKMKEAMKGGQ